MTTRTTSELVLVPLGTPASLAAGTYSTNAFNARQFDELLFGLQVPSIAGGGTLNVFIDVSTDGSATWHQLAQLGPAGITAPPASNPYPSAYELTIAVHQNKSFGDYLRVRSVLAGTITALSYGVYAVGKGE